MVMAMYAYLGANKRAVNFVSGDTFPEIVPEGCTAVELNQQNYGYGWLWNGTTLVDDSISPPPAVPESVTPRQVRLLLLGQGLLDQVEQIIAASDRATQITWEFASEFQRDNPLLLALAQNLNLTEAQVDEFFIAAAAI